MTDYNTLAEQIKRYANRTDGSNPDNDTIGFAIAIPDFIAMGQQRIWREARDLGFEIFKNNGNLITNSSEFAKPINWNKTISLLVGTVGNFSDDCKLLYPRTYEFCRAYWPDQRKVAFPQFYSDHPSIIDPDQKWLAYKWFHITPTPDANYKYELTFLAEIDPITNANQTNLLTNKFPDLLFYACFLEALAFLKDDERIQIYEANYGRALQAVNNYNQERSTDRSSNAEVK